MFNKEAKAEFLGHQIAATAIWSFPQSLDVKLYIDGQVVDSAHSMPKGVGYLKGRISAEGKDHVVEVFSVGWFNWHLVIKVDGNEIGQPSD